jgi:long-chain acyl-CoA synthetase
MTMQVVQSSAARPSDPLDRMGVDLRSLVDRLLTFSDSVVRDFPAQRAATYAQLHQMVRRLAAVLEQRGVAPAMRIGVAMENSSSCLALDLALLERRCVSVTLPPEIVAGGLPEAVERYDLTAVVCDEGVASQAPWMCTPGSLGDLVPRSTRSAPADPRFDVPAWVFSSGTTGRLRCIETYRPGIEALVDTICRTFTIAPDDHLLVFLPMHSFQQRFLLYAALWNGLQVTITSPRHLLPALARCAPTIIIAPPSLYEAFARRLDMAPPARRAATHAARLFARRLTGPLRASAIRVLGAPLRAALGGRTRLLISGMAPIGAHVLRLFEDFGLPITEVYGMTECGMIAWNTPGATRLGSVGRPLADAEVRIAADGEVLVRRREQPSRRYLFEDAQRACETYGGDGVIATGDLGHFDADGFLYLSGRKKNLLIMPTGEKFSPEPIERELQGLDGIAHALVLARARAIAVVCSTCAEAADSAELEARVRDVLRRVRPELALVPIVVTAEQLTVENGLLTSNLKPRRDAIAARFLPAAPEAAE